MGKVANAKLDHKVRDDNDLGQFINYFIKKGILMRIFYFRYKKRLVISGGN